MKAGVRAWWAGWLPRCFGDVALCESVGVAGSDTAAAPVCSRMQ